MSTIRFGITVPQGWRNELPQISPADQFGYIRKITIAAEKYGFDAIYAYDHLFPHYKYPKTGNFFECFTLISALSSITKKIKIGQVVTCNSYRNPALVAKMLATLDVITNGRAELGIGAGWYEDEYHAYGYDYDSDIVRIARLDESIQIIRKMWMEKSANFHGRYYSIKDAICFPKPIQKPYPIIMVGGSGEKYLLKVVAKYADRYNLYFGTPDQMRRKINILKEYNSQNRKIEYSIVLPCLIVDKYEDMKNIIKKMKGGMTVNQFKKSVAGGLTVGTIDEIINGIGKYVNIGVDHFIFHFLQLDERVLEKFSKVIKISTTSN